MENRMKIIEKKYSEAHIALVKRAAANGSCISSAFYRRLEDLNDARMQREMQEAFKPSTRKIEEWLGRVKSDCDGFEKKNSP